MKRAIGPLLALVCWSGIGGAQAQRIAAINSDRGRLILRNDASFVGIGIGSPSAELGFSTAALPRAHFDPQFAIAPSLDIFIIPNLSLGGTIGFTFNRAFGIADIFTFFFMPRVGYNIPITNHFSLWPQFAIGVGVSNVSNAGIGGNSQTEAMVPLDLFVPFLYHPVENFLVGLGPALRFYSLNDKATPSIATVDILRFTLGGSVPIF